jgi:hypothetical protein
MERLWSRAVATSGNRWQMARPWKRLKLRKLIVCGLLLALVVGVGVASARPPGTNGQITFGRFNPALDDTQVYVINPDGSHERLVQGATDTGECPKWFPDGAHIATCGSPVGVSRIINPDDQTFRDVGEQQPGLFNPCGIPSPDGTLLLCETFSEDGSQNGIHAVRSSDGGDSVRSRPTRAATTSRAAGRRTGGGSSSSASARRATRECSLST